MSIRGTLVHHVWVPASTRTCYIAIGFLYNINHLLFVSCPRGSVFHAACYVAAEYQAEGRGEGPLPHFHVNWPLSAECSTSIPSAQGWVCARNCPLCQCWAGLFFFLLPYEYVLFRVFVVRGGWDRAGGGEGGERTSPTIYYTDILPWSPVLRCEIPVCVTRNQIHLEVQGGGIKGRRATNVLACKHNWDTTFI